MSREIVNENANLFFEGAEFLRNDEILEDEPDRKKFKSQDNNNPKKSYSNYETRLHKPSKVLQRPSTNASGELVMELPGSLRSESSVRIPCSPQPPPMSPYSSLPSTPIAPYFWNQPASGSIAPSSPADITSPQSLSGIINDVGTPLWVASPAQPPEIVSRVSGELSSPPSLLATVSMMRATDEADIIAEDSEEEEEDLGNQSDSDDLRTPEMDPMWMLNIDDDDYDDDDDDDDSESKKNNANIIVGGVGHSNSGGDSTIREEAPRADVNTIGGSAGQNSSGGDYIIREEEAPRIQKRKPKVVVRKQIPQGGKTKIRVSRALSEIRKYQSNGDLLLPKKVFQSIVREIMAKIPCSTTGLAEWRIQREALAALQVSGEDFIVSVLESAYSCTIHAKRVTLMPADLRLAMRIRGLSALGFGHP